MEKRSQQLGVGTLGLTDREKEYVHQVLDSDRLSYGPFCKRFEKEFAELHECNFAVFVNSGTSALRIALACLKEMDGWQPGDEILVPALTFVATVNVIIDHGFTPVFVDCDANSYNIDVTQIEDKITDRTVAIMPVHLFGQVADMDPILDIAKRHSLRIVEDSAETLGVSYKGRKTGSFGDISCFSTYIAHLVVTGVGGLAVTKNPEIAAILRSLANHGRDGIYISIDDDKDIDGAQFSQVIKRRFRFVRPGYSFRATEMEAAIGVGQLERLPDILSARQRNAAQLTKLLQPFEQWLQLPHFNADNHEHAFMMFPLVIRRDVPIKKEDLVQHLEEWNVETRDMVPLINQPVYEPLNINQDDFPNAKWINECGFYIGCHQALTSDDLEYIQAVFQQFFAKHSLL